MGPPGGWRPRDFDEPEHRQTDRASQEMRDDPCSKDSHDRVRRPRRRPGRRVAFDGNPR